MPYAPRVPKTEAEEAQTRDEYEKNMNMFMQAVDGDTLKERLAILKPESQEIQAEIEAIQGIFAIITYLSLDSYQGDNRDHRVMRVLDRHYENGVLTGAAAEAFKKCQLLGLEPRIKSEFYRIDNGTYEGYMNHHQLVVKILKKPKSDLTKTQS